MFCLRAAEGIAAAATSLPRLDALVFTGGIGENDAGARTRIVRRLGVLGVQSVANRSVSEDAVLSDARAAVAVLRIEAREDLVIADSVAGLLD
jgi:acetate kinase